MPLRSIARLIQTMLYAQRFFPYYVYNILGGIEEDGKPIPFFSPSRTWTQSGEHGGDDFHTCCELCPHPFLPDPPPTILRAPC